MKRKTMWGKSKILVLAITLCLLGATVYALTYRPRMRPIVRVPSEVSERAPRGIAQGAGRAGQRPDELLSWGAVKLTPAPELEPEGAAVERTGRSALQPTAEANSPGQTQGQGGSVEGRGGRVRLARAAGPAQLGREDRPGGAGGAGDEPERGAADGRRGGSGVMARFDPPEEEPEGEQEQEQALPEIPRRDEVAQVMNSIRSLVQRCYDTSMVPGRVDLTLIVEGSSGRVIKTHVSERSSTAICIRRLARTLRFPEFSRPQITIKHPYTFR